MKPKYDKLLPRKRRMREKLYNCLACTLGMKHRCYNKGYEYKITKKK